MRRLLLAVPVLLLSMSARADVLSQYSFTGNTLNATTVDAHATGGAITASPKVNNQFTSVLTPSTGVGYPTQPFLAAARSTANESGVRSAVYFSFTLNAQAGYELDLSSLSFSVAQGGGTAGTRDYDIRSSVDNFATSLTGDSPVPIATVRPTFSTPTLDLSGAAYQNLSAITFQFRFFTPGVSQNVDFDDITVNGATAALPEPGMAGTLLIATTALLRRRSSRR